MKRTDYISWDPILYGGCLYYRQKEVKDPIHKLALAYQLQTKNNWVGYKEISKCFIWMMSFLGKKEGNFSNTKISLMFVPC